MRHIFFATFLLLFALPAPAREIPASVEPCFTPGEDCTQRIVSEIAAAKKQVLVQAYSFTSAPIAKALLDARKRGVEVRIILDDSQAGGGDDDEDGSKRVASPDGRYSPARFFANQGLVPLIDDKVAIAHNKVMIIDGVTVITGSFNFTKSAQTRNAENVLVVRSAEVARLYAENWQRRAAASSPFKSLSSWPYSTPERRR